MKFINCDLKPKSKSEEKFCNFQNRILFAGSSPATAVNAAVLWGFQITTYKF